MMAGTYMKQFLHELRREAEMSNHNNLQAAIDEEARRRSRSLMAGSFVESGSHLNWPKLDIGAVPKIDLLTGRPIPSEPYKEPEPRIGTERTRQTDRVSDPVNRGIDATLDERGKRYGSYTEKAAIIQEMKIAMRTGTSWTGMDDDMKESLEMVVHKIGRIVTGDARYHDNWHDLIGYAKLVADRLEGVQR